MLQGAAPPGWDAERAAQAGGANGKFAGDDVGGTFEGKFASTEAFYGGLDHYLGLPDHKVLEAVVNEHRNAGNADKSYTTSNYDLTCTPKMELVRACANSQAPHNHVGEAAAPGSN